MPELKHEQSLLTFELSNGAHIPKVCLENKQVVLDGTDFLILRTPETEIPARITQVTGREVIELEGEFPGMPDLKIQVKVLAAGDYAPRFDWHIQITNLGSDLECGFRVRFQVADKGIPRWMIPAMFYKHNRPENCVRRYPRYSPNENKPEEFVSSYWAFRSDRSSCPAVFCWTDNYTSCLATPALFAQNDLSGVAFRGDESGTFIMLDFPYVEEPVKYSFFREDGIAPEKTYTAVLQNGSTEFSFSTFVDERDLHAYDGLVRDLYDESEDETNPWLTKLDAEDLLAYGLHRWHYDPEHKVLYETCAFDKYFGKGEGQVDRPHMHVAWVSGAPYAYALWRHGQEFGKQDQVDAGLSVLDKIADEGISPCGLFWPEWTLESGWGTGWNPNPEWIQARTVSECTWFYLKALDFGKGLGTSHPNWESAVRSNLEAALKVQRQDGNFGSYYNVKTRVVEEWDGAAGLMWIPALLAGAKCFGEGKYQEAAVKAGEYYARFVEDEYIYGAPEDVHLTPTSEDGYNAVIAYVHLYEATNDKRWLELAQSAADWTATFRWIYNTKFPEASLLGEYDFRTLGGDIASPSNNHLHNYGLICHPELLRLWQYTGDTYYLSRAADHLACFHQFIARQDGDFNARMGMITEQWFHTDWTHAKGSMLQLAHAWCAGLILYANAYTREFGEIIIDAESREVYALDSVWIRSTEEVDSDVVLTLVNPSLRDLKMSVRHSALGVVGAVEIGGLEEIRVRIGGTQPSVEVLSPESELWT